MAFHEVASNICPTLVNGAIVANINRRVFSRVHAAALGREWDLLEDLGAGLVHFARYVILCILNPGFLTQNEIHGNR